MVRDGWDGFANGADDDWLNVLHLVGVCRLTIVLGGRGVVALALATLKARRVSRGVVSRGGRVIYCVGLS